MGEPKDEVWKFKDGRRLQFSRTAGSPVLTSVSGGRTLTTGKQVLVSVVTRGLGGVLAGSLG